MPGGANFKLNRNPHTSPKVKKDDEGLYVRIGEQKFRPGSVEGYDHQFDMRDGGLSEGQEVFTTQSGYKGPATGYDRDENIRKISTREGAVFWHAEGQERTKGLRDHPEGAVFNREGTRQPFIERDAKGLFVRVPHYAGDGMLKPGQLDTYRLSKKDGTQFEEGQAVDTFYAKRNFFGKEGSALNVSGKNGEIAKLKLEGPSLASTPKLDIQRLNALSMATGFGR